MKSQYFSPLFLDFQQDDYKIMIFITYENDDPF